ncbi:hypothetical protein KC926_00155 [Candidatus Kaiserbacteria bacterium]|nr:hypothetical protein [Candidatus Kaiserbacteria bacterium]
MENYGAPKPMKKLGDLFEKYRNHFKAPQASVVKEAVLVIKEVTGFDIPIDKVKYNTNTRALNINMPSIIKSELKFHHQAILSKLSLKLGSDTAPKNIF